MNEAREFLQRKHAELQESVRMLASERREAGDGRTADTMVWAANTLDDETRIALIGCRNQQRIQIEATLERLERGEYGRCRDCDGFIGLSRLRALPFAQRCSPCQERSEETASRRVRRAPFEISTAPR
jgi:DnaK suppressor protein